jgi:asparagine synthase (glutamine-hydrolysing)
LREIELKPKVAELWPQLIHHLDEPIADPAAIACFLICKLARENGTKVLLSGQGGDELFCGYPRYLVMHATQWLTKVPPILRALVSSAVRHLPGSHEGSAGAFMRRIRRGLTGLEQPPEKRFPGYCANTPQEAITRVLSSELKAALEGRSFAEDCLQHMEFMELSGLQRLQERDLSIYLPNHNLLYTDKMGMAVGLEARVPLLDMELVNRVLRYPYDWQLARGKTKVLFREAARGVVPDEIIDRPKAGFGAPYRKWLRYDLNEMWHELTSESAVRKRGWFDYKALQEARARSQSGKDDLYMLQWAVLTVELWARQSIDHNPAKMI